MSIYNSQIQKFHLFLKNRMFSEELINQLSQIIIRPHREIYGLDRLGPKKLIVKNISSGAYMEAYRTQCTIFSQGKKIQMSIFQPFHKPNSSTNIHTSYQSPEILTKSLKNIQEIKLKENSPEITIFLHSNSGSRLEGLEYIKFLLQYGQTICLFDYSGSGVSEGEYVTMGLNEAKDLQSVIHQLKKRYGTEKFNIWGRSMGAVTAVLYASQNPQNVKKMVLDSPFSNFKQLVKQIINARTGLPEFLYGSVLNIIQNDIFKKTQKNLMEIDLKKSINNKGMENIPCLFLISKQDKLVHPSHVQQLFEVHKGHKKIVFLDGSHNKPRPTQIREQCASFLCKELNRLSSLKKVDKPKKSFHQINSRKFSQDCNIDGRPKYISTSLVFNEHNDKHQLLQSYNSASIENGQLGPLNLNSKTKIDLQQSSTANTQRQDQSLGKLANQKISLSQLKKNQNKLVIVEKNYQKQKQELQFKKHPKTMAIQYKNKMKKYFNQK